MLRLCAVGRAVLARRLAPLLGHKAPLGLGAHCAHALSVRIALDVARRGLGHARTVALVVRVHAE